MRVLRVTPLWDWTSSDDRPRSPAHGHEGLGGHAAQVLLATRAVARTPVQQTVLTLRPDEGAPRATVAGVPVLGVGPRAWPGTHRRNLGWLGGVVGALAGLRRARFDVVHVHASGIFEPLLAALLVRRILRVPIVLTLHHCAQATYVPRSRRDAAVQVLTRAAERAAVRASATTFVLTSKAAETLGSDRVEVLPDGVDVDAFAAAATAGAGTELRARLGIPPQAPVAVFAGRLSPEKGWDIASALPAAVDGLHVLLCGDGPDRAAADRGAHARTHVLGRLPQTGVAQAFAASDVHVLPSAFEELGSVLLEAMACGVPSVAFDVGGVREAVVPSVTGTLVPAGDVPALVSAVVATLADGVLRETVRSQGPELARTRFGAEHLANRLVRAYDTAAR